MGPIITNWLSIWVEKLIPYLKSAFLKLAFQLGLLCAGFLFSACSTEKNFAPVVDINTMDAIPKTGFHRVTQGETLYAIAWRYGLDYRFVASQNHILPPYAIHPGEHLKLPVRNESLAKSEQSIPQTKTSSSIHTVTKTLYLTSEKTSLSGWVMPAKGRVTSIQNGINISGKVGQPIYAARQGRVVYCGNGLRGYGNLIIIKHNSLYLSAYAHNRLIYVKEGEEVKKGQKIAEMGNSGTDKTMLHFEIRKAGKPINPISVLHS